LLVVPTTPKHWRVDEVLADPIATNSLLGTFTHFGNVLDLNGISVPTSTYSSSELNSIYGGKESILPFAITLIGGSQTDNEVLELARRFEQFIRKK
jgi:Asp-tRNA(Asn)/Glu-tRNA(Gln) amidotransferase A subunit family amidase